jgi:hypothetical protein
VVESPVASAADVTSAAVRAGTTTASEADRAGVLTVNFRQLRVLVIHWFRL